jgi:hypothetical protein
MLMRSVGYRGSPNPEYVQPGDVVGAGETIGTLTTAGSGTILAATIAQGILLRSGPAGGFTDTTDTAVNILTALAGPTYQAIVGAGTTFRFRYINSVAFAMTFAAGAGVVAGVGTLNVAASLTRDYLLTVQSTQQPITLQSNTTNASPTITFVLPPGMTAYKLGPDPQAVNIQTGATVTGTNISAGTTVIGVTISQAGITGVTLSANATGTTSAGGTPLTFGPTIKIDSIGAMTA